MSDRKTFEYGGYHFTPIRKFHKKEGDFFAISKRLASDPNLGLCTYQDRQKAPYDYKDFYTVSTDKECDIFRCEENGLLYVPGKNELFIYHEPKQKNSHCGTYDRCGDWIEIISQSIYLKDCVRLFLKKS